MELGNVLHYASGRIVYIQINGGQITGITDQPTTTDWINCGKRRVIPGLFDGHVHGREDQPDKELWPYLERAAILGGVTNVARMPNQLKPNVSAELIAEMAKQFADSRINNLFWLGATNDNFSEIGEVFRHCRDFCRMLKIYMGSSTGNLLVSDPEIIRRHMQACAEHKILCGVHAEDEGLMQRNLSRLDRPAKVGDHCAIRDTEVEVSAVKTALKLQLQTDCILYFCHISTPEALELIQNAKQGGRTVFAEVCPHHLYLTAERLLGPNGGKYKMNPALRTAKQVIRMQKCLCQPGWVDCVASDHAPHKMPEEKLIPADNPAQYKNTASGVPGVQTILPLILNFVRDGRMSWEHFVNLTSFNIGQILALPNKGRIEVGYGADLVVVNEEYKKIRDKDMATLWTWTPFADLFGGGFPFLVIAKGSLVYKSSTR